MFFNARLISFSSLRAESWTDSSDAASANSWASFSSFLSIRSPSCSITMSISSLRAARNSSRFLPGNSLPPYFQATAFPSGFFTIVPPYFHSELFTPSKPKTSAACKTLSLSFMSSIFTRGFSSSFSFFSLKEVVVAYVAPSAIVFLINSESRATSALRPPKAYLLKMASSSSDGDCVRYAALSSSGKLLRNASASSGVVSKYCL